MRSSLVRKGHDVKCSGNDQVVNLKLGFVLDFLSQTNP